MTEEEVEVDERRGSESAPAGRTRETISLARRIMSTGGKSCWKRSARYSRIFWFVNISQEEMVPMWWKKPRNDCSAIPVLV